MIARGEEGPPRRDIGNLAKRVLAEPITRRKFFKITGAAGVGLLAVGAVNVVPRLIQDASTREEQEKILEDSTKRFLESFNERETAGVGFWNLSASLQPGQPSTPGMPDVAIAREKVIEERTRVKDLMESGVALADQWSILGKGQTAKFDERGRLSLEGRTLRVNESVLDYHLALNILRTKLALIMEKDNEKRTLLQEDHDDLLFLLDLHSGIEVHESAWSLMPKEWAISLARFYRILDKAKLPYPAKCVIDPDPKKLLNSGGFYTGGAEARFPGFHPLEGRPVSGQIINLSPKTGSGAVFHEGAHYIADIQAAKKRMIGPNAQLPLANYQAEFDRTTGEAHFRIMRDYFSQKRMMGDLLESFVSGYAATDNLEDFASTFEEWVTKGPLWEERLAQLKNMDPQAGMLLEAKINFFRNLVGEFSFDARRKRPEIATWEKRSLDWSSKPEPYSLQTFLHERVSDANQYLPLNDWAKEATFSVVWTRITDFDSVLLNPQVWEAYFKAPDVDSTWTSAVYPVPHMEINGKFEVRLPTIGSMNGEEIAIDTGSEKSIRELMALLQKADGSRMQLFKKYQSVDFNYTPEIFNQLKDMGIKPPRFSPSGIWTSRDDPPTFINNEMLFYAHFQQKQGRWEKVPLDAAKLAVHQRKGGRDKGEVASSFVFPTMVGDNDVLMGIDQLGNVVELVMTNFT